MRSARSAAQRGAAGALGGKDADGAIGPQHALSGTDAATFLQAGIDAALADGASAVLLPGVYRTADSLHIGDGAGFAAGRLIGDGVKYRGVADFSGTALLCDFSDRPGVALQGGRSSGVSRMTLVGKNTNHVEAAGLGGFSVGVDDTVMSAWLDPSLHANANSRYAPYAALAVDPFSGPTPSPAYPNGGGYGKVASHVTKFADISVTGFAVGLVVRPNGDGNADFTHCRDLAIEYCAIGVSISHTQHRLFRFDDGVLGFVHTGFASAQHGVQNGKVGGLISNTQIAGCIQWFDFPNTPVAGPVTFLNCYGELVWRLGRWGDSQASGAKSLALIGCEVSFTAQTDRRGRPAAVLDVASPAMVSIRDTTLDSDTATVFGFRGAPRDYEIDNCNVRVKDITGQPLYMKIATNFLAGWGFEPSTGWRSWPSRFSAKLQARWNITTGASYVGERVGPVCRSERAFNVCAWAERAHPSGSPNYTPFAPSLWRPIAKSALASLSLNGSTLTIVFASWAEWQFALWGPLPGDVLYDDQTGTIFFVRSRSGLTVLAEIQTNFRLVGGTFDALGVNTGGSVETIAPFSTTVGNLYAGNARAYLPSYYLQGDVTSGSAIIANAGRDDGYADFLTTEVLVGDWLFVDDVMDRTFSPLSAQVGAVDAAAKTITLSGNATRTAARKPLGFFVRQPPANV